MAGQASTQLAVFVFLLLAAALVTASPSPDIRPRLDQTPLRFPNLPPGLFITYTGTLHASFQLNPASFPFDASQCAGGTGAYFFADTANSTMRIGVNPPSLDPNPVFFMIEQRMPAFRPLVIPIPVPEPATPARPNPPGSSSPTPTHPPFAIGEPTLLPVARSPAALQALGPRSEGLDTTQTASDFVLPPATYLGGVKDLLFASLYATCTLHSRPCSAVLATDQSAATYSPLRMLDLTRPGLLSSSSTSDDSRGGPAGPPSYTLRGDQSTWASTDPIEWSGLDFSPPANYTSAGAQEPPACAAFRYPPLVWNASAPMAYELRFSNASAALSLSLTAPLGTVTVRFAGSRAPDVGAGAAVQVGPGAGGAPRWSFVNGTGFHFDGVAAVADPSVAGGALPSGRGGLASGAAGMACASVAVFLAVFLV